MNLEALFAGRSDRRVCRVQVLSVLVGLAGLSFVDRQLVYCSKGYAFLLNVDGDSGADLLDVEGYGDSLVGWFCFFRFRCPFFNLGGATGTAPAADTWPTGVGRRIYRSPVGCPFSR